MKHDQPRKVLRRTRLREDDEWPQGLSAAIVFVKESVADPRVLIIWHWEAIDSDRISS